MGVVILYPRSGVHSDVMLLDKFLWRTLNNFTCLVKILLVPVKECNRKSSSNNFFWRRLLPRSPHCFPYGA